MTSEINFEDRELVKLIYEHKYPPIDYLKKERKKKYKKKKEECPCIRCRKEISRSMHIATRKIIFSLSCNLSELKCELR